ncbi:MAG: TlpA family protein disulfide reductase [Saprospiraceae bacterium]|nr:TlpA family protein disulfide reductase [Saprospiraceae bacterium]
MNWSKLNKFLNIILVLLVTGYVIYYVYRMPKYKSGEKAQDFTSNLISGDSFKLSELKGYYVLLNFWGSWCGPCRKENPELVMLYQSMKDKTFTTAGRFEIVSIGLESEKGKWERAVQIDGLAWKYQFVELDRFSGPIAKLYGVKELPAKYFISPEGMILMVNPKISEIHDYLDERQDK